MAAALLEHVQGVLGCDKPSLIADLRILASRGDGPAGTVASPLLDAIRELDIASIASFLRNDSGALHPALAEATKTLIESLAFDDAEGFEFLNIIWKNGQRMYRRCESTWADFLIPL